MPVTVPCAHCQLVSFGTLRIEVIIEDEEMQMFDKDLGKVAQDIVCSNWHVEGLGISIICLRF